MKKIILTIISCFILIHIAYPQTTASMPGKPLLNSADTLKLMSHIDSAVLTIKNNLSAYKKVLMVEDSTGHSYEYVKDYDLKEINLDCKDPRDNKYKKVDWYFENGKEIYSESVWTDNSGNIIHTDRVYVFNEQLIAWFDSGKRVNSNSASFKELMPEVVAYAAALTRDASDVAKGLPAMRTSGQH